MLNYLHTLRILYTKKLRNRLSKRKRASYQKFLIIGLARSGTTLLHTYLNSHPHIISGGERALQFVKQELLESSDQQKVLFPPYASSIKAAGAKILLPLQSDPETLASLKDILSAEPSIKILFLYRENVLAWHLSLLIARRTKQWSQTRHQKKVALSQKQLSLPVHELVAHMDEISVSIQAYRRLFSQANMMEISYESLSSQPSVCLTEIQAFLGLQPRSLTSLLQKQNPEPLSELIKNYEEVAGSLRNTPYEKFLKSTDS